MFKNTNFIPNIVLVVAVLGFGLFIVVDAAKTPPVAPAASISVQNQVIATCRDGTCYDTQTGKEIGNDPEVPIHLTMPVSLKQ